MAQQIPNFSISAAISTALLIFHLIPAAISHDRLSQTPNPPVAAPSTEPIPPGPAASTLTSWIDLNMKEYNDRKDDLARGVKRASLDQPLVAAEDGGVRVINVMQDGSGQFKTVMDAVKSIPPGNTKRVVIRIGRGEYKEKVTIERGKNFVTFLGDPTNLPKIVAGGTAAQFGTVNSATVAVESDYFVAVNIIFENSAPAPDGKTQGAQAIAMRISGDKAAFHNCRFIGFQDTLCDDKGIHFFQNCHIQGTVDFIFGNGKSLYLNTTILSLAQDMGVITAQARENVDEDSGFTFAFCNITGMGGSSTFLGRAWKERPRVIFANTFMGTTINSEGWSLSNHNERSGSVYYGEYKCSGPGATPAARAKFAKTLSDDEAKAFTSLTYIHGSNWILPPPKF